MDAEERKCPVPGCGAEKVMRFAAEGESDIIMPEYRCPHGDESNPYHQKCRELADALEEKSNAWRLIHESSNEIAALKSDNAALQKRVAELESEVVRLTPKPQPENTYWLAEEGFAEASSIWEEGDRSAVRAYMDGWRTLKSDNAALQKRVAELEGRLIVARYGGGQRALMDQRDTLKSDNAALRAQLEERNAELKTLATAFCIVEAAAGEQPDIDHAASVFRRLKKAEAERDALMREKAEQETSCVWERAPIEFPYLWFRTCTPEKFVFKLDGKPPKFCACGHRVEVKG